MQNGRFLCSFPP